MKAYDNEFICLHDALSARIRKREWGFFTGKETPDVPKKKMKKEMMWKENLKLYPITATLTRNNCKYVRIAVVNDIDARRIDSDALYSQRLEGLSLGIQQRFYEEFPPTMDLSLNVNVLR